MHRAAVLDYEVRVGEVFLTLHDGNLTSGGHFGQLEIQKFLRPSWDGTHYDTTFFCRALSPFLAKEGLYLFQDSLKGEKVIYPVVVH